MVKWVLLLIIAEGFSEFETKSLGYFDTIAQCHVSSTKVFWEDMPLNQEAVCIRVEVSHDEGH